MRIMFRDTNCMVWCGSKVKAGEAFGRGCVTALGDAAHPTTPAVGQVRALKKLLSFHLVCETKKATVVGAAALPR